MAKPAQTSLGQDGKHAGHPSLGQDVDVGDAVLPGDAKESAEAAHVESIQPAFLVGVEGPCFTAVEESAQYTGLVDSHLGVCGEHGVVPHSLCQTCQCCCCLANPRVQLCIKGEVAGDGGPEVGELVHHFEGVVADRDARVVADVLTHDLCLFQADGEAELCTGSCKAVNEPLQCCLRVGCYTSIVSEEELSDQHFLHLCLCPET